MRYWIGVDGGGSHVRAVVIDADGRPLGRARAGGAVATVLDVEGAARAVRSVVRAAATDAGTELPSTVLWAGLAGVADPEVREQVRSALASASLARHVVVGTDVEAAFHDAFGDGPGVLLVAGTGSIAWARSPDGGVRRVGGRGRLLGDEGSGYALGLGALRLVLRAFDGRDEGTALTPLVLEACGVPSPEGLVGWAETASKADIASLAPDVARAAEAGDPGARRIVDGAVDELVAHVRAITPEERPAVVVWGGLLADGGPLAAPVREALEARGHPVVERALDAALGAARLALEAR